MSKERVMVYRATKPQGSPIPAPTRPVDVNSVEHLSKLLEKVGETRKLAAELARHEPSSAMLCVDDVSSRVLEIARMARSADGVTIPKSFWTLLKKLNVVSSRNLIGLHYVESGLLGLVTAIEHRLSELESVIAIQDPQRWLTTTLDRYAGKNTTTGDSKFDAVIATTWLIGMVETTELIDDVLELLKAQGRLTSSGARRLVADLRRRCGRAVSIADARKVLIAVVAGAETCPPGLRGIS